MLAEVRPLRAGWAPVALAWARMRAAPGRVALAAVGIALAVGLLGAAAGGGAVAGEQGARALLQRVPDTEALVRVSWSGVVPPAIEAQARRGLSAMTGAPPTTAVVLRPGRVGRAQTLVQVAGVAPAARWLALRSGRLPTRCTPARCEVVQVSGAPIAATLRDRGVTLVVVGRATLRSAAALGFLPRVAPSDAPESQRPAPVLVSADPRGLDALAGLASVYRSRTWSARLDAAGVASWDLARVARRVEVGRARLAAVDPGLTVDAPLGALAAAQARAHAARSRVLLVAAGAATLLVAFALLVASALGRDAAAERGRLDRRGARGWQLAVFSTAEAAGPATLGVLVGAAAAIAITALRARSADVALGPVLDHTLLSGRGLLVGAACWVGAIVLAAAAGGAASRDGGRLGDVLAVGAAAALAAGIARGGVDADAVAGGTDPLPALLPALACLAFGVVVLRLVGPLLRLLAHVGARPRGAPRGGIAARTALVGLARSPRQPAMAVAFLAVGCGLALFAASYTQTLRDGQRDEAAFAVPLDLTVSAGSDFVRPLSRAGTQRWRTLAGGPVLPVVRASASLSRGAERVTVPLVALPAGGLGLVGGWNRVGASASRSASAAALRERGATGRLRGTALPAGARTLRVRARTAGDALELTAIVQRSDGAIRSVALGATGPAWRALTGRLPRARAGDRLVALAARPRSGLLATQGHAQAENPGAATAIAGALTLRDLRAGATPLPTAGWIATGALARPRAAAGGAAGSPSERGLRVAYAFTGDETSLLRPRQATDGRAIPVLADPRTAAAARDAPLALVVAGVPLRARVVGTLRRFPTVGGDAAGLIVADTAAVSTALDAARPGAGAPTELWIDTPRPAALREALARPPLAGLQWRSRDAVQTALRHDPLAVELLRVLAASAILAGLLCLVGLLLCTWSTLRDDGAELYDLESQGVPPSALARSVRLRAAGLAGLGIVFGLVLGAGLSVLVVDAVAATAATQAPFPPLAVAVPWGAGAAGLAAFALAAWAAVRLVVGRAFAGPVPRRPRGGAA